MTQLNISKSLSAFVQTVQKYARDVKTSGHRLCYPRLPRIGIPVERFVKDYDAIISYQYIINHSRLANL